MTRALAITTAVLLAAALALGVLYWRARGATSEAERKTEAVQLSAAGELVAASASSADLQRQAQDLAQKNSDLAAALDKAKQASPGIRTVYVDRLVTAPLVAGGEPRPAPALPPPGASLPVGGSCPPCLLAPGDRGELRATIVGLETKLGNQVVIGTAEAWRLEPAPATRLLSGPFSAPLSSVAAVPARRPSEERPWTLSLSAEWDPFDLRAQPEWTAALSRRLLGPISVFGLVGRWYDAAPPALGAPSQPSAPTFSWQLRAGVSADIPLPF